MEHKFSIGDIVEMKKQHPCGNKEWEVTRVGADFKIKCLGCGHIVMLPHEAFVKRMKRILPDEK